MILLKEHYYHDMPGQRWYETHGHKISVVKASFDHGYYVGETCRMRYRSMIDTLIGIRYDFVTGVYGL